MYIPFATPEAQKCRVARNRARCSCILPGCGHNNNACEVVGIGLGSNLGPSAEILRAVLHTLRDFPGIRLLAHSSLYASRPMDMQSENWFVNAVALLKTTLSPRQLMLDLQRIEADYGRVRTPSVGQRVYQDRALDLDILFYGDQLIREPDLVIPHPRMLERLFVLKPLAEIAGDYRHPLREENFSTLACKLQNKKYAKTAQQTVVKMRQKDNVFVHDCTACACARMPEMAESFLL